FGGFDRLMPYRVREILLVASPYDAFIIAEDDKLTEIIFSEYLDLNIRYAPRVTRVSTAEEALERIRAKASEHEPFDMIITMLRVGDMNLGAFTRTAKRVSPGIPVFMLAHNLLDIQRMSPKDREAIDRAFLWTGNARILLGLIKQIEDRRNIDHDIQAAGVQTILLVEDSVRFYSYYLPLLYTEVLEQTQKLMSEGVNLSHKMLRIRARAKILLATSYEEAWDIYEKHRSHILGIITDVQFPKDGVLDPDAGIKLIERIKQDAADIPTLLQSSDQWHADRAAVLGAAFLYKGSSTLLEGLRAFILENMGFGDFVFRDLEEREIGRAPDLHALVELLRTIPDESIAYHAKHNHFSKWLMARTEFELAHRIRPKRSSEFKEVRELRRYLIKTVEGFFRKTQSGVIADFSSRFFTKESHFVRIGGGSLGGKGRGLAFLDSFLSRKSHELKKLDVRVRIPNTTVIATDEFGAFIERNNLAGFLRNRPDDEAIRHHFLEAKLPPNVLKDLNSFVRKVSFPLAVRSSSLLEDSQIAPFAGVYQTYMLPNNHPDPALRLKQLERVVKLIYASTHSRQALSYVSATPHLQEEEKMAVILQRLVGRAYGDRFYPDFSGIAQSYNYYPVGPMKPADGIAYVTLGLGNTVVEGGRALNFSPGHPRSLYQFSSVKDSLANSQREFSVLDLSRADFMPDGDPNANLLTVGLDAAEADGTLAAIGATYSRDNDRIYDGIGRPGARLVTFAEVLKGDAFPLADVLKRLLEIGAEAVGCPIEMEFAVTREPREFNILQIRPMISWNLSREVRLGKKERSRAFCYSPNALGHGAIGSLSDLIYVKPGSIQPGRTRAIADEIGRLNAALGGEGRNYVLMGPGRWGSADPNLGIPVQWGQISASRLIVETAPRDFCVEPSYGTHFLHNVIAAGIGYLTVGSDKKGGIVDWKWLGAQKAVAESENIRHLRFKKPLDIRVDGRRREGAILRPE
ncbi:MAG: PEP/pyruvate-binding domain-containing protein, partial [Elusimicrobiota bacterium]